MQVSKLFVRSGLVFSMLGAAGLVALPVVAQTSPGTAPAAQTSPGTAPAAQTSPGTAPAAMTTDDDAAEFAKLDKNKDGAIDKTEAVLEPRLLTNFDAADTNKDGKVDKNEWAAFQKNKALIKKQ